MILTTVIDGNSVDGLERWLSENRFDSVDAIRDLKTATHVEEVDGFLRAKHVASLQRLRTGKAGPV